MYLLWIEKGLLLLTLSILLTKTVIYCVNMYKIERRFFWIIFSVFQGWFRIGQTPFSQYYVTGSKYSHTDRHWPVCLIYYRKYSLISRAIQYLFPSGLSDPNARPVMRPPDEILPKFNRFSFDSEGRPIDSRFFTLSPNFYSLLSVIFLYCNIYFFLQDVGIKTAAVNRFYSERLFSKGNSADLQPVYAILLDFI